MKMRRIITFLLVLTLAAAMLPAAGAEYLKDQYFEAEDGTEEVYAVQIAASSLEKDSCALRDRLLSEELDGFVLHRNQKCCVMSGKFATREDAQQYSEVVNHRMHMTSAAIVKVSVPAEAAKNFREEYVPFTGLFTDSCRHYGYMSDREFSMNGRNIAGIAVQVAQGPNREAALELVQQLRDLGYYAYLYDDTGKGYINKVVCGVFGPKDDAEAYKASIQAVAGVEDAYLIDVRLPKYAVKDFNRLYYGKSGTD